MTNEEMQRKLFDVSARLEILSGMVNGLYNIAFCDSVESFSKGPGAPDKAVDWFENYYDLLSNSLVEIRNTLDEQAGIIDDCLNCL
jgi:hypothetical protein